MKLICPRCRLVALNEGDRFCYSCGCSYNVPQAQTGQVVQPQPQFQQFPPQGYPQPQYIIVQQSQQNTAQIGLILSCIFGILGAVAVVIGIFVPFYDLSLSNAFQNATQSYSLMEDTVFYSCVVGVFALVFLLLSIPALGYGFGEGVLKIVLSIVLVFVLGRIGYLLNSRLNELRDQNTSNVIANLSYVVGFYMIVVGILCNILSGIIEIATGKRG